MKSKTKHPKVIMTMKVLLGGSLNELGHQSSNMCKSIMACDMCALFSFYLASQ